MKRLILALTLASLVVPATFAFSDDAPKTEKKKKNKKTKKTETKKEEGKVLKQ